MLVTILGAPILEMAYQLIIW